MPNRIKHLMKQKKITRQTLAERIDAHPVTVSKLISGENPLNQKWLNRLSVALEVSPAEILQDLNAAHTVPVVGYVGAGAQVFSIDDHAKGGGLEEVEAPFGMGHGAVAVIVRGDSMRPALRDGDMLFYDFRNEGDLTHLIGTECIVQLADGRTYVKELAKGSAPGFWTLLSHNDAPIYDVAITWAAKVKFIKRR